MRLELTDYVLNPKYKWWNGEEKYTRKRYNIKLGADGYLYSDEVT